MNTISPLSGIQPVGSSTSNNGGKQQGGLPRQGQTFQAMVIESKGNNTFVLDINGSRLSANAKIPLSVGQTLQLQVAATSPQVELRVVADSANLFQGKAITLLGNSIDLKSLFLNFKSSSPSPLHQLTDFSRQTLESFFNFNQGNLLGKEGGGLLKQFIDRLGLSFESLLARGEKETAKTTLKSALLELSNAFKNAGDLAETTNKLLGTIELYQLAQVQLEQEDLFIFPLPLSFLKKGYLIIDNHKNSEEMSEEQGRLFSLHLSLEGLGNIRIDLLSANEGVYIRFFSDSKEKLSFIKQFKDDLHLSKYNSKILGITFSEETADPSSDLLRRLLSEGESLVNTKV